MTVQQPAQVFNARPASKDKGSGNCPPPELSDVVPADLRARPQWVCWKSVAEPGQKKPRKLPVDAKNGQAAKSNLPATWTDYDSAVAAVARYRLNQSAALPGGVGFVFTPGDPFAGVDLDHCRNPETGEIAEWAQNIIRRLNSYTEVSPSRTGVKIWVRAKLPPNSKHDADYQTGSVEMYDWGRFFAVTGRHVSGTPKTIEDRQAELTTVHADVFGKVESAPAPQSAPAAGAVEGDRLIPKGQGDRAKLSLAGLMFKKHQPLDVIQAAIIALDKRCEHQRGEEECKRKVNEWAKRYAQGGQLAGVGGLDPWNEAEGLDAFLESGEDGADFLDPEKRILARASITEIFSPRGLGKSLFALCFALQLARRGLRVMYVDRDNPRHIIRDRLRSFGATGQLSNLKVISREKCPPLTNADAWAVFPYQDFDVVILDSFDSAAEGIGEQDSAKPSRAIAPVLDIARREAGPAVLILGNTVKSAQHSRGSGVIEDRADVVYEVRDATGLQPSGSKPWLEELPPADASAWVSRTTRRGRREKFRLAFVASKFRVGQEPEAFVLELDLSAEPWTIRDVTSEIDAAGAEAREKRAREYAEKLSKAREGLAAEVLRRVVAGEPFMLKDRDAIPFLTADPYKLRRTDARDVVNDPQGRWLLTRTEGQKGHPVSLLPPKKNEDGGGNAHLAGPAKIQTEKAPHFRRPHPEHTAEIATSKTRTDKGEFEPPVSAEDSLFYTPEVAERERGEL